jgi:hypothetical protein
MRKPSAWALRVGIALVTSSTAFAGGGPLHLFTPPTHVSTDAVVKSGHPVKHHASQTRTALKPVSHQIIAHKR